MLGLAAAALLAAGVGLNWSAMSGLLRTIRPGSSPVPVTVATRAAELDTVNLPDGSRAILAPNSSLHYAIAPLAGPRELRLEGEAYFDVKHDDERPFRVQTPHAVVEDLGTTFVVREYAGDGRARVAVRTGAAALHARDESRTLLTNLRPGEGAYVDSSGAIVRFSGDPESYGSWSTGRLEFDAAPLPEVLSELARWYDVEFQLSDSTLNRQYFTGAFDAVSLTQTLGILGPIVHARFEQQGREVIVIPRPSGH
jgi:ferric-dicitrate binding protein FerR (iron transport regulator)